MRRRRDGHKIARQVVACLGAYLPDGRKAGSQTRLSKVAGIEPDILAPAAPHHALYLSADNVSRRELRKRVYVEHETLKIAVEQVGALAPERLAHEEARRGIVIESRGVELDELHVGDGRPGAPRRGDPVSGRDSRVGRDWEDLARAARRKYHRRRVVNLEFAGRRIHQQTPTHDPSYVSRSTRNGARERGCAPWRRAHR